MIYGYARVSSEGQSHEAQRDALQAAGAEKIFSEKMSGARADRQQLARALKALAPGDLLIVTRLDRLARSTRDLLNMLAAIDAAGAMFRSLREAWADTTTPHGRLMVTIFAGMAEFERELITARTTEGRMRAKARGVHMGRPRKLTLHQLVEGRLALASGTATHADLARRYNVDQSTISRRFSEEALVSSPSFPKDHPVFDGFLSPDKAKA